MPIRRYVLLFFALLATAGIVRASDEPLHFGVLNQQSVVLTAQRWNPILDYVSRVSGVPLRLKMGRTVDETNAMMARGEFDFLFTNHIFQSEYDSLGYRVIARWGGEPFRGVVVVAPHSRVARLKDLAGRRVAFPSGNAFVAYAVPMVALREAGVSVEPVFAGNQEGALAQLKAGRVEAAAVNSRNLAHYSAREKVSFREIHASEPFPDLAVIAHPGVPGEKVERVRAALVGMKSDPAARDILAKAQSSGFEPATDRDYDGVRRVYRAIGK